MSNFINNINAASGVKAETPVNTKQNPGETMGQQEFLKLFVTQLQNQDPLNPQEATEMSTQLAQYSQLEQLTNLNNGMKELVKSNQDSDKLSSLNTLGKNVAYESSTINFQKDPVEIGYKLDAAATDVSITIKKNGAVVAKLKGEDLDPGSHYLVWDGKNSNGQPLPAGKYTFSIQATDNDGKTKQLKTRIRDEVTGIDLTGENGGTIMTRSGKIAYNKVIGVFDPLDKTA